MDFGGSFDEVSFTASNCAYLGSRTYGNVTGKMKGNKYCMQMILWIHTVTNTCIHKNCCKAGRNANIICMSQKGVIEEVPGQVSGIYYSIARLKVHPFIYLPPASYCLTSPIWNWVQLYLYCELLDNQLMKVMSHKCLYFYHLKMIHITLIIWIKIQHE